MKKTKNTAPVTETRTTTENDLAVIVTGRYDAAWIGSKVAQPLMQSRNDIAFFVVSDDAGSLLQQADIAALHAKGKAIVLSSAEWKSAVSESRYSWFFIADKDNVHVLPQAVAYFSSAKKSFVKPALYTGIITKESGKEKRSIGSRISNGFFNFTAQLITPTAQKDFTLPYHYFHKSVLLRTADDMYSSALLAAAKTAYLDLPSEHAVLTAREAQTRRTGWGSVFSNAFSARMNWFFKEPLRTKQNLWRTAFAVFSVFALVSMLVMSRQFGMTWDEKRHNDYSKESLKYLETFGADTTCLTETLPTQEFRYYGEHFNVIAAFLYTHVMPSFGEYETRHLLNALYGFLAMLFAALLAKEIGSWRSGVLAFVLIYLSPVFFGHSMNNPTDIPFAAGFAIALYYLIKIYRNLPAPKFSYIFMAAVGIGMAVGSRVGGILLYAYAGLFFGIHFLLYFKKYGFSHFMKYLWVFVRLVVTGHLLSVSIWPFGRREILTNWYVALKRSTEGAYFTYNHELFEGVRMYMGKVPGYYLPKFMLINTPLMVLLGLALCILLGVFAKRVFKKPIVLLFTFFALVFPIIYAEYQGMYYYNGWRHYLFVYPSVIVLAAIGYELVIRLINKRPATIAVVCIALALGALPAVWMMKNTPNEYVYFNELTGGTKGAYGKYETDYYSNSCRAAGEWLAKQEPGKKLIVGINNEPQTAAYYAAKINPALEFRWLREYEEQKTPWDYAIYTSRTYSSNELLNGSFPPKGTVHVVEADGIPLAVVVKREDWNMPLGYKALQETKQLDSAIYYFTAAAAYNPMDEEAWRMLGMSYAARGSADSALMYQRKAIEIYPENYVAYNDMGQVYMTIRKDYATAIDNFKKAIALKINYTDGYYYAAACYMNQDDYLSAIGLLENALKYGSKSVPEIYYNLGVSYLNTGNNKKAQENFISCLSLNQNYTLAYRALAQVFMNTGRQQEAQQLMQRYTELGGR